MLSEKQRERLQEPFPEEAMVSDTSRGFELTSIKAIYVVERLNDVFGIGGWRYDILEHHIVDGEVTVWLSLEVGKIVEYELDGHPYTKWLGIIPAIRTAGGRSIRKGHLGDALKGAVTDALTKAASILGVGIDVFKGKVRVGDKPRGRFQVSSKDIAALRSFYKGKLSSAEVRRILAEETSGGSTWGSIESRDQWERIRSRIQRQARQAA